jgi:hypothetical protein
MVMVWLTIVMRPAMGGSAAGQSHVAASTLPGESSLHDMTNKIPANTPATSNIMEEEMRIEFGLLKW